MFSKWLKKEKPRVFLGNLAVVPRTSITKIDEWGMFYSEELDVALRERLTDIFSLPPASEVINPRSTDLVIDVVIPKYQSGDAWDISLGEIGLFVFWRPKVEIRSRIYELSTNKTKSVCSAVEKMKWRDFLPRLLTWRALFRFKPIFDKSDIEYLLYNACLKMLDKVNKGI